MLRRLKASGLPHMSDIWIKHQGRCSLALDILEKPRTAYADRFVLSQINLGAVAADDFDIEENGAVFLKDIARKKYLSAWQTRKQETITHPFLGQKLQWWTCSIQSGYAACKMAAGSSLHISFFSEARDYADTCNIRCVACWQPRAETSQARCENLSVIRSTRTEIGFWMRSWRDAICSSAWKTEERDCRRAG